MVDDLSGELERNIPLYEMVQTLRRELQAAMAASPDEPLRFHLQEVELELAVEVTDTRKTDGKISFWVVKGGREASEASRGLHTFRLKLKPQLAADPTGDVLVSSRSSVRPE